MALSLHDLELLALAKIQTMRLRDISAREVPSRFRPYQYDPAQYIRDFLKWEPWSGSEQEPGQMQVIEAYALAIHQQIERREYELGNLDESELTCWVPGAIIKKWIKIPAGFTVGKTKLAAGLVNHFFDCFSPAIIYAFAPSDTQIHDLLLKEVKADRRDKGLPGRILDRGLKISDAHFMTGRATSNVEGRGRERVQGQHGPYLMYVLDEAEGIEDYVWDAVESMTTGGVAIVLMLGNPRTRVSQFHKISQRTDCATFRISETWHPNVVQGREVVPGAIRRDSVDEMIDNQCSLAAEHNEDEFTFTVPWRDGIFRPSPDFMYKVLGIAPLLVAENTIVPLGRYQAALKREADPVGSERHARMGIDVARFGTDVGTLYLNHAGIVRRLEVFEQDDTFTYARKVKAHGLKLAGYEQDEHDDWVKVREGVESLHIRIDGGGGFAGGVIDHLAHDVQFLSRFKEILFIEVHFNSDAYAADKYADLVTEMYFEAAESLQRLAVMDVPQERLEGDLCERTYGWVNSAGREVRKIQPKERFKAAMGRSPDDGDGFVLAAAPDYIFLRRRRPVIVYDAPVHISPY